MPSRYATVSFLSDYGHADEFVGVVHSVIRTLAPEVRVVDLVHDLAPHDVRAASLALVRAVQYVAPGLVLAVVDPGVATARRALVVEVGDGEGAFVGPDNGLLAPAVALSGGASRAFELTNLEYQLAAPGPTFAGRDIFAPAAAHLCNGVDPAVLGPEVDPYGLLPGLIPLPRREDGVLVTEVLWIDRYGNCQLNAGPEEIADWGDRLSLGLGNDRVRTATLVRAYGDLAPGQVGLVVDAYGMLSIAFDRRNAADELGISVGGSVVLDVPA
jgi:S-adenosylmethionine hydrolase